MPSGAKKRKALKKKKEQEAFGASPSNKGSNGHGCDEHGSQDEGESDGNLSSPGSQGYGEVWTRDPSPPSPLSGLKKDTVKEITNVPQEQEAKDEGFTALGSGTCHEEKNGVAKPPNTFAENVTHNTGKAASNESGGILEIAPADDSVSEVVITKNGQAESSTDSDSVQHKANESQEKRRLEEAKEGNVPETSQVPECSEEKSLLPSGPPVTRASWLSCCGLFDVVAGSER